MSFLQWIRKNRGEFVVFLGFLFLAYGYCFPLLKQLYLSGRGDWDYFAALYEIPSITLYEYGQLPLWNPYLCGGMPLIGNPQAGYLSPIFVVTSLLGVFAGLKIAVWLHTFIGLWGMWLLSGHLGIRGPARFAPSIIFMFSGPWVLHLAEGHIVWLPGAFLPILFLAYLKGLSSFRWLVAGAVVESVMLYEGGTYVLGFSLVFMAAYAIAATVNVRSLKPLGTYLLMNTAAAGFSSAKLIPVLELLHRYPRRGELGVAGSWGDFLSMYLERGPSLASYGCETGAYFGIVVLVLYVVAIVRFRSDKPLIFASLLMMLVSLGNFGRFSPWALLHALPLYRDFHLHQRASMIFIFSVALMIGLYLGKRGPGEGNWQAGAAVAFLVLFIGADLFTSNSLAFRETAKPVWVSVFRLNGPTRLPSPPELYSSTPLATTGLLRSASSVHLPFRQIRIPDLEKFRHGGWSDQYLPLLQNTGVVDAYEPIPIATTARATGDVDYKGEHWLSNGGGKVVLTRWSPNRLSFHVSLTAPDTLVINQNFWPGWGSSRGLVRDLSGLLAVDLPSGDYGLQINYTPISFWLGASVSIATGILLLLIRRRSGFWKDETVPASPLP